MEKKKKDRTLLENKHCSKKSKQVVEHIANNKHTEDSYCVLPISNKKGLNIGYNNKFLKTTRREFNQETRRQTSPLHSKLN